MVMTMYRLLDTGETGMQYVQPGLASCGKTHWNPSSPYEY